MTTTEILSPPVTPRARVAGLLDGTPAAVIALLVAVGGCGALLALSVTGGVT